MYILPYLLKVLDHHNFLSFLWHDSRNKGMKHSWKNLTPAVGIEPGPPC